MPVGPSLPALLRGDLDAIAAAPLDLLVDLAAMVVVAIVVFTVGP